MPSGAFFGELTPLSQVAAAVSPFILAMILRWMFGRRRWTEVLVTVATSWFFVNVLIAPYAVELQRGLHEIIHWALSRSPDLQTVKHLAAL
jgi:hypothetical protein